MTFLFLHKTMASLSTILLQLLILIPLISIPLTDANNMYCSVSADIREFERYFGNLKEILVSVNKHELCFVHNFYYNTYSIIAVLYSAYWPTESSSVCSNLTYS